MEEIKINDIYTNSKIQEQMLDFFENESFIQLTQFLSNDLNEIKKNIISQKFETKKNIVKYKKSKLSEKGLYELEIIKLLEFFKGKDFLHFLENITGFELRLKNIEIIKYEHRDFILLHDDFEKEDVLEIYFDLSDDWNENYGGVTTYTTKEEEILYLEPIFNSLSIVFKPIEVMKYLKYINNLAKKNKILRIEMKFEFLEDEGF